MKQNKKIRIMIILSLFFLSLFINTHHIYNKSLSKYDSDSSNLRVATFWGKIHIDNNWSWTAGNYTWCTGSGMESDPYIIEDLIIDGGGSGSCIFIENSIDYFIITNCTVYNSGSDSSPPVADAGILMYSVSNGTVINNNCSFNFYGAFMAGCNNNAILGNNFTFNDERGLFLSSSSNNNTILQNTIHNNKAGGIYLGNGEFNNITENTIHKNVDGIYLENTDYNNISNNNISSNNDNGIELWECNNNTIYENNCYKNGENGINIEKGSNSQNNTIKKNNITNNGRHGIYSSDSSFNKIVENRINNSNLDGISLEYSINYTISSNYLNYNLKSGISIDSATNITILANEMKGCGLTLYGISDYLSSYKIDRNNLVNNKSVYYYANRPQLGNIDFIIDGKNPGQIILVECNNAKISDFELSNTSIGLALHYCTNISFSNNNVSNNNINGIYSKSCNNLTISGNNITNNPSGIHLDMCHNNSVLRNNASFNYENAIYLEDCNNSFISENIAINNTESGIFLRGCDYNNLTKNIVINNSLGICLDDSHYNNVLNNNASYNVARNLSIDINLGQGLYLKSSDYNNLSLNKLESNTFAGIYLHNVNNVTITKNRMDKCGLYILLEDSISPLYEIDTSNLVNNKPLYYYCNETVLNINKSINAGQVLLVNCNQSIISNLNLSYCTAGMMLWNCYDNFIFNNSASFNYIGGILLESYCHNNSLFKNNVTDCGQHAISINRGDNNNITHCIVENSLTGIFISDCDNITIFNNTGNNNFLAGIYVFGSSSGIKNIHLKDNVMKKCGLVVFATNIDENSFIIDNSNSVNGKPLYYYCNEDNLIPSDFSNPGQIFLINSNNAIISDVNISNASAGIILYNCINNSFYNVTSTYNNFSGLFMAFSNDCTFFNNNINDNYFGMLSFTSNNYSMFANKFEDNAEGLNMHFSNNFTIYNNSFSNNKHKFNPGFSDFQSGNGLSLSESSSNNKIYENLINNNERSGIIIEKNSDNNTVLNNIISNNLEYGSRIKNGAGNNTIYYNNFLNNGIHAGDDGTNNQWDDGFAGNYWEYYSGSDIDRNNIVDNPYLISGITSSYDAYPLIYPTNEDTDGEGLYNFEEYALGIDNYRTNVTNPDSDYDELSDYWEWKNSTNPWNSDTDFDKMPDAWEVFNGLNATYRLDNMTDPDNDLLLNLYEFLNSTDPQNNDTDFDKMPDGWEVFNGLNATYRLDNMTDPDNDLLFNLYEFLNGTDPQNPDTDFDNIPDGWEVFNGLNATNGADNMTDADLDLLFNLYEFLNGTDPQNPDTDFDNIPDGWEVFNGLNATNGADNMTDPDLDLLLNLYEFLNGTDPQNPDTDFDNIPDGWEVFNGLNATNSADNETDNDNDGLSNIDEYISNTDPFKDDTDGDTFLDGDEVLNYHTNPLNRWWYPMPNLEVISFNGSTSEIGKPFALEFTIKNNGIIRAENVLIIIRIEGYNITLWNNSGSLIDLEVDQEYHRFVTSTKLTTSGEVAMEIILDPYDLINETYSNKDGSLRAGCENDNYGSAPLKITGELPSGNGIDLFWILLIIIGVITIVVIVSSYLILKPRMKKKATFKKQIETAKNVISDFETNIRSFIKTRLMESYESIWWDKGVPEYIKATIGAKIETLKSKKPAIQIDKVDLLDFTHYSSIITFNDNWEQIFSKTYPNKELVETNLEKLRLTKKALNEGTITLEQLSSYPLNISTIRNYFTKGFNVFLSYSTLDTEHFNIKEVANRLENYPQIDRVFFWEEDSGENIVTYMERTLAITKVFVFFCSENSVRSNAVKDEWQAAFQMRKKGLMKIVPVYENEDLIPFLLTPLLNVKFTKDNFDIFIQKLYEEILR